MIRDTQGTRLWMFLGDSLTEGIGNRRESWVSQLVLLLRSRTEQPVHAARLRILDLSRWRDLSHFNMVGHLDFDKTTTSGSALWIVNLAAEGTTIRSDIEHSTLIAAMRPDRVFILRGPLETIGRPQEAISGGWPIWVPGSWRHHSALDPRCYFSSSKWRRLKQITIDYTKQRVRSHLLKKGNEPLMRDDEFISSYFALVGCLKEVGATITVLALPPVSESRFPGTMPRIVVRNRALADLANKENIDFVTWPTDLDPNRSDLFCRDGFHPTEAGSSKMATWIYAHSIEPALQSNAATDV